jgi:hypothetical protein
MGRVGLANLALFQVVLPCLAPLIDVFLVYGLLVLDPVQTLTLWGAVLGLQMLVALLAFAMERENPAPILWMPLQQLAYRQMMYAVLIKSIGTALAGVRLRWQKLKRVGQFGDLTTPPPALPDLPPLQPAAPAPPPVGYAQVPAPVGYAQVPAPVWGPQGSHLERPAFQPTSWPPSMPMPAAPVYDAQTYAPALPGPAVPQPHYPSNPMAAHQAGPPPVTTPPPWPAVTPAQPPPMRIHPIPPWAYGTR